MVIKIAYILLICLKVIVITFIVLHCKKLDRNDDNFYYELAFFILLSILSIFLLRVVLEIGIFISSKIVKICTADLL